MKHRPLPALAICLLATLPAHAQTIGQAESHSVSPWRIIASLLLCLALGTAAILALRHRYGLGRLPLLGNESRQRRIAVIEQQSLGPQRSICLIEIDGRDYAALFAPQTAMLLPLPEGGVTPLPESTTP